MANMTLGVAPGRFPVISHAIQLLHQPLDFLMSLRGFGDIVKIRLGTQWVYVVRHPDLIRKVLVTDADSFDKGGEFLEKITRLTGNGLATCPHAEHGRQRRLLQPVFNKQRLANYATVMQDQTIKVTNTWRVGQVIDVEKEMATITVAIIANTIFSGEGSAANIDELAQAIRIVLSGLYHRILVPIELFYRLPTPSNKRFDKARTSVTTIANRLIQEYRKAGIDRGDLLSALLAARDDETGTALSDEEIIDQIITFFIGGTETSAATLSWTFYVFGQHPEIERRVQAEIDEVLAGRPAELDDLGKLDYTRRVIMETLRLYSPVWMTTRVTTAEVELGGHRLPPKTTVLLSPYLLHRDPDNFENPESFDPDRWLPDRAKTLHRYAMIPFGTGKRTCIGETFSMNEMTIMLAIIAGRMRLRPVPGSNNRRIPGLTLHPALLSMKVESRSSSK